MSLCLNGLAHDEAILSSTLSDAISKKEPVRELVVQNVNISGRLLPLLLRLLHDSCDEVHLVGSKCNGSIPSFIEAILSQTKVKTLCVYDLAGRQLTWVLAGLGRSLERAPHIRRISIVAGRLYAHNSDAPTMKLMSKGLSKNISLEKFELSDFDVSDDTMFGLFFRGLLAPRSSNTSKESKATQEESQESSSISMMIPSTIKELKISNAYYLREPVSLSPLTAPGSCPPLVNLKHLTMHRLYLSREDWHGMGTMCPNLEYLDVQECDTKTVVPFRTLRTLHVSWTLLRQPRVGKKILEDLVGRKGKENENDDEEIDEDPYAEEFEQTWKGAKDAAAEAASFAMDPFQDASSTSLNIVPNTNLYDMGAMLDGEDSQKNSAVRWLIKFYLQLNKRNARRNVEAADAEWIDTIASMADTSSSDLSSSMRLGLTYYVLRRNPSVWSWAAASGSM